MPLRFTLSIAVILIAAQVGFSQTRGPRPPIDPTPLSGGTFIDTSAIYPTIGAPSVLLSTDLDRALGIARMAADPTDDAKKAAAEAKEARKITFQPLIQIKVRIVEVDRANGLSVSSILDYVSSGANQPSLTTGDPLNAMTQNFRGITDFGVPGLINGTTKRPYAPPDPRAFGARWVPGPRPGAPLVLPQPESPPHPLPEELHPCEFRLQAV